MASNKTELLKKLQWFLTITLVVVIIGTEMTSHHIIPWAKKVLEENNFYAVVIGFFIACLVLLLLSAEVVVKLFEFMVSRKKGKLHGWWIYAFLFPVKPDESDDFICFSIKGVKNVLVVGFLEIHHDDFEMKVVKNNATSKTFKKQDNQLHERVTLKIKNIDYRNNELIIVYETSKSRFVPEYRGIMDWQAETRLPLIKESLNKRSYNTSETMSYNGAIQDLKSNKKIVDNPIYSQHLRHERNRMDVEKILEREVNNIIKFAEENFQAKLIS